MQIFFVAPSFIFFVSGDGKLSGLLYRHDELCHLSGNIEKDGDFFDYPSMGQAARILNERNILLGLTFSDDSDQSFLEHAKNSYRDFRNVYQNLIFL